ncbi:MAG: hypothetical protein IKF78_04275 [Atopobiaceae bacterium]|nr:hypothetical protein [Atopobiaceae bacterium]
MPVYMHEAGSYIWDARRLPGEGDREMDRRRHDAIERLWRETNDGSFLGTVVVARPFWDFATSEHDWWHHGRLAEMDELAKRLSETTALAGNERLVWEGLRSVVDVVGAYDTDIYGSSDFGYTQESVRWSIIECHMHMDRPYCDVVTRNLGRLASTDGFCSSFIERVGYVTGFMRDELLGVFFCWRAFLMMTLAVALVQGWGPGRDQYEYAGHLDCLYRNDGGVHRIDASGLASTCVGVKGNLIRTYVDKAISELGFVDERAMDALSAAVGNLPTGDVLETDDALVAFLCLLGIVGDRRHTMTARTLFHSEFDM